MARPRIPSLPRLRDATPSGRGWVGLPSAPNLDGVPYCDRLKCCRMAWEWLFRGHPVHWVHEQVIRGNGLDLSPTGSLPVAEQLAYPVIDPEWLQVEIIRLKNVGTLASASDAKLVCPVFLRPKPGPRKWRLIHDLRPLNAVLPSPPRVRFEGLECILPHLRPGAWLYSVDLEDAYHHVPLADNLARLCCLRHGGEVFSFRALPFGLSWSPAIFTKLLRPVLRAMRIRGFLVTAYLDDLFGCEESQDRAAASLALLIQLLEALGFKISSKKGPPQIAQRLEHLGLVFDTESFTLSLPAERIARIEQLFGQGVHALLWRGKLPRSMILRLQGTTAAALAAVAAGKASTRALALARRSGIVLPELLGELLWWRDNLRNNAWRSLHPVAAHWVLTTDASPTGYGAVVEPLGASEGQPGYVAGLFSDTERQLPQAMREGLAVVKVLHACFPSRSADRVGVHIRTDSVFTVALIRGGSHSSERAVRLTKQLHTLLERRNISATASHIAGVSNHVADALSRQEGTSEWPTHPDVVLWASRTEGPFELDLFASALYRLPGLPYVSLYSADTNAAWCDAFSRSWAGLGTVFASPPLGTLPRVLRWASDHGLPRKLCLLHPRWPSAAWWPQLMRLRNRYRSVPTWPIFGSAWGEQAGASAGRLSQWRWELSVLQSTPP